MTTAMTETETFVRCDAGHLHWGQNGAAGLLLAHIDASGVLRVMLHHRAAGTHNAGTYGWPGGAIEDHESALTAAYREADEETGLTDLPGPVDMFVLSHGGWSYTTLLVHVDERYAAEDMWEGESVWVTVDEARRLPLVPGALAAIDGLF